MHHLKKLIFKVIDPSAVVIVTYIFLIYAFYLNLCWLILICISVEFCQILFTLPLMCNVLVRIDFGSIG